MFHDIKSLLNKSIRQAGLSRQVEAVNVVEFYNKISAELIDPVIASQTEALYFRNGILTIECKSSLIMQELQYKEIDIINSLNEKSGRKKIVKLRYLS